jgi:hypothetical protein
MGSARQAGTTGRAQDTRTAARGDKAGERAGERPFAPGAALQRSVGNRAVARMVQRTKSEEQRGRHQRRTTMGAAAVQQLAALVKRELKAHIFQGAPMTGQVDRQRPQGLHAYTTHQLPTTVETVGPPIGNTTKVHIVNWRYAGERTNPKSSTMFPQWMSADEVSALIALDYPGTMTQRVGVEALPVNSTKNVTTGETRPITKEDIREHIVRGADISLEKSGDTVYPTHRAYGS